MGSARVRATRSRKNAHQQDQDDSRDGYGFEIIDTKGPIQQARKYDQEFMQVVGNPNAYRATVCVLCDRLVIGCETVHKITREELLSQSARISVESYEAHHQVTLKPELVSQYHISGLDKLLLSKRAKQAQRTDGTTEFEACSQCYSSWLKKHDTPPKHAISNGFAIGHIPTDIIRSNDEVTDEMCSLLSPVRPFAYIFAYTAGAHKASAATLASSRSISPILVR